MKCKRGDLAIVLPVPTMPECLIGMIIKCEEQTINSYNLPCWKVPEFPIQLKETELMVRGFADYALQPIRALPRKEIEDEKDRHPPVDA